MKLYCVGCGPGDPELLTVKAVNLIKDADIIFAPTAKEGRPSIALSVVKKYVDKTTETISLIFPMLKDKELKDYWKENAKQIAESSQVGKKSCIFDGWKILQYIGTWIYIHKELKKNNDIEIDIVPGIASMFAFAAEAKMSLAEGDETLAIVPACYDLDRVKRTSNVCDTVISSLKMADTLTVY